MYMYEYYITGFEFDEITPEIIGKLYADEFDNYLDEYVGTSEEIAATAKQNDCFVDDIIREAMWDFARIVEENPCDFYLNIHEIVDCD